jgi:hypothetical protein
MITFSLEHSKKHYFSEMKTTVYNPSPLETEIANVLVSLQKEIENALKDKTISYASADLTQDNPSVKLTVVDKDGDPHTVIMKVVQVPDKL